ncbi:MAG: response regulator [Oligoflexales bacterium]
MEKNILIVDDSEFAKNELKAAYTAIGMKVVGEASDGLEALEKCELLAPDIISLDLIMPHMHGIECAREIHKRHPQVAVLFVTSLARDIIRDHSFGDEFDAESFVQKPATSSDLKAALLHVVEQKIEEQAQTPELEA